MEIIILSYLALGAVAGVMAGLLGVGGGLLIVPVLVAVFSNQGFNPDYLIHMAVGTSLATIIPTSFSSVRAHHKRGSVRWDVFKKLAPGIAIGAVAGAFLAREISSDSLKIFFACFEFAVAAQMAFGKPPSGHRQLPGPVGSTSTGGFIGVISAIIGIGGGTLSVPFMTWCNIQIREAIGTASALGMPIAAAGMAGFVIAGWNVENLPQENLGFVNLVAFAVIAVGTVSTAPLGAALSHKLPIKTLKRIFALVLVALGVNMLL